MTQLSVANRLRIGLALLLALLAAGYVLSLRQPVPDANRAKIELAQSESEQGALVRMQAAANAMLVEVEAFARDRDAAHEDAFRAADQRFEAALKQLAEGAARAEQRRIAREIGERHARYRQQGEALLRAPPAAAAPDNVATFYDYQQRTLRALLADLPWARPSRISGRTQRKQEVVQRLRETLRARAEAFSAPPQAGGALPDMQPLAALVARYQAFADTNGERAWGERAARALRDGEGQAAALATAAQPQDLPVGEVQAAQAALQALLAQHVRGPNAAELSALLDQVRLEARRSRARLADALLGLLAAGVVIALGTLYLVRAPLKRLAASTRAYTGDLSFVSIAAPGDEVAELHWAIRRLTQRAEGETAPGAPPAPAVPDEATRQAALAFQHAAQAMLVTDAQRRTVLVNAAFEELTGYGQAELLGRTPALLWSPDHHDPAAVEALWAALDARGAWQGELALRTRDGDVRPAIATCAVLRAADGALQHVVMALGDRAALRVAEEALREAPHTPRPARDPVSAATRVRLEEALANGGCPAILRLHVPTLDSVSDALGGEDAHALLREVRARVAEAVASRGEVLENDGAAPLVLLERAQDAEALARIARDILRALSVPARFSGLELPVHASAGIAQAPGDGESAAALLASAGVALERARSEGGNAFQFTSPVVSARLHERITLEDDLRDPKLTEQLTLHFQPLLALRSGKAVGVEALLRWRHPQRGMLAPESFLAQAEAAGILPRIGEWVLRNACLQVHRWVEDGLPPLRVAVNLSRAELADPALPARVRSVLEETGLDPHLLQLEIDERSLEDDGVSARLDALQGIGLALTLTAGRDSEVAGRALTWLPFTRVKFRAALRPEDEGAAPGLAGLARSLSVGVVAEHVETEAQAAGLRARGVDELQGFLIGRPLAAREFELRMRHANGRSPAPVAANAG
jgi:PAS domain S-box-containing protein